MVINRFPSEGLSADYGDIILSSATDNIDVKINIGSEEIHHELYTPDNLGMVYIREVGLLAMNYYTLPAINTNNGLDGQSVILNIILKEGDQDAINLNTEVFRCAAETSGTLSIDVLKSKPLSRTDWKLTGKGRKEFISFYGSGAIYVDIVFAGLEKDQRATEIFTQGQSIVNSFYRYDVSPSVIAGLFNIQESQIAYYSIFKIGGYGIRYEMDPIQHRNKKTFLFRNTFGAQESFTTTGDDNSERKWSRTFGSIGGNQVLTDQLLSNIYTVNTGYINRCMVGVLEDMLQSKMVELLDEYGLHKISIQEESFKVTSRNDEVLNVEFKYNYSSNNELQFRNRFPNMSFGPFDNTFDNSFPK